MGVVTTVVGVALGLGLVVWPFWIIYKAVGGGRGDAKYCTTCGHFGKSKQVTKGHLALEVFLWCLFILPGLLYSVWRLSTRTAACPECGAAAIVPLTSPVAKAALSNKAVAPL